MSAGIIKTPSTGRSKDANVTKSAERTGSAGKKLVQTRLPFKLITTPLAKDEAATTATPSSAGVVEIIELDDEQEVTREPRKRKLSYSEAEQLPSAAAETEQLRRSNSKENMAVSVITSKKSKATEADVAEDVVELDADEDDDDEVQAKKQPPTKQEKQPAKRKKSLEQAAPIQIKLPLSKRAKRRKHLKKTEAQATPEPAPAAAAERSDSSDDIEAIAQQLNPQKKPKVLLEQKKQSEAESSADEAKAPNSSELELDKQTAETARDSEMEMEVDKPAAEPENDTELEMELEAEAEQPALSLELAAQEKSEKHLTPKQLKLMEQRRQAREVKEQKLLEERRLKQQEKEQQAQQRKSEREAKEEVRRKEREDKEKERRKEREERERKRQAETEEKRKRNEAKEEALRQKNEERKRKEQEKEEAELKKKRAAASFSKFFVAKQLRKEPQEQQPELNAEQEQDTAFRPFQIKEDMILAPVRRTTLDERQRRQLDSSCVENEATAQLYLEQLRQGAHKPLRSERDARLKRRAKDEDEDDEVQVIDDLATAGMPIDEERAKQLPWMRVKYLHFADNRRPPYYGTWRKRSQLIKARRPLAQDKAHFDYEVDSDCEWEEEEPGESLSASEDEKERESEEESEEEYNEWFVPHGHLSDEELQNDDEQDNHTREAQQAKLQVLQQEFAQEMKKQTKKIKPRLLGPVWLDAEGGKSLLCPAVFTQTIEMYACWQLQPLTLEPPAAPQDELPVVEEPLQLTEPLLQQLVRLIHGNSNSKQFLISEYLEFLKTQLQSGQLLPAKTLVREKFDELASWKPVELTPSAEAKDNKKSKKPKKRLCWLVSDSMLQKYELTDLTLQNQWNYTLTPKSNPSKAEEPPATPTVDSAEHLPPAPAAQKKRNSLPAAAAAAVELTSTSSPKLAFISKFLRKPGATPTKPATPSVPAPDEDVVMLSD